MSETALIANDRSRLVWVMGADAVSYLDGLLSQNVAAIPVGGTARSLLLGPQGKLRALLHVLRDADRLGLVCDAGVAGAVMEDLSRYRIRVDVEVVEEQRQVWEVWGEGAAELVGGVPAVGKWVEDEGSARFVMPLQRAAIERAVVVGRRPSTGSDDPAALEALRIAAGEAIMGVDVDEKTIPQEGVDVSVYVDFDKGCYLGQELVARIDARGHVNRRLAGIDLEGGDVPAAGAEVIADEKTVGKVTSAAWSERHGRVLALVMIRVEVKPGTAVTAGGIPGTAALLPILS